ncbi:MAG: hypothetical protein R2772_06675 [Chitinophagales bacterium]
MKKKNLGFIALFIGLTFVSIIGSSCDDGPTFKEFWFNTPYYGYNCFGGSPAVLTKQNRGAIQVVVKKMNGSQEETFYNQIHNYQSAGVTSGGHSNGCVYGKFPTSGNHRIYAYYNEFNSSLTCGSGTPNMCLTWINANRNDQYASTVSTDCADRSISITEYIGHKNCFN